MPSASATVPHRRPVLRRVVLALLALVLLIAAALAIAPALVPTEIVRDRIVEQIEQWLGRPVTSLGEPVISLYPRPTVRLQGVTIGDALGSNLPFIAVDEVIGTVALLPLLLGRVEIREFALIRPRIDLRIDEAGQSNWAVREGTLGARMAAAQDDAAIDAADVTLGRFRIEDGTIAYQRAGDAPSVITAVTLDIAWPSTSGAMSAEGSLVWRDERVELTATLADPLDLIAGRASAMRFTIDADPASIAFDGTVDRTEFDFSFAGETAVRTPALRRLLAWAGAEIAETSTLGPAVVDGAASWAWPVLAFASATMSLDGNAAMGSFAVDFAHPRPSIRGTIAAGVLDLSPYAVAFRSDVMPDGTWIGAPIDLPALALIDSDLRLSADEIRLGAARLTDVAASAAVNDGRILLSLEEATFYGGSLRGTVTGDLRPPALSLHTIASLRRMAVLPALTAIAGVSVLTGALDGDVDVGGAGTTWSELVARLTGSLSVTIMTGSLRGIDLEAAAALISPTVADLTLGTDATEFTRFDGRFRFADGWVEAESFAATGPAFTLAFAGRASMMRPAIEGRGLIALQRGADAVASLPFRLAGTWIEPILGADAGAAPDASPAAAPIVPGPMP